MNSKWKLTSFSLGLAACLGTAAAGQAPGSGKPQYTVTDLGVLGKGNNATSNDMNSIGWVAGQSNLVPNGPQHSFLWYGAGPLVDIGTLGGPNSGAGGPNLYGEAAVESELAVKDPDNENFCAFGTNLECRGTIWRYGKLTALPRLPGGRNSNAFGVNNLGQVIGWYIGCQGKVEPVSGQSAKFRQFLDQLDQAIAQQRLTPGNAHLLDPKPHEKLDQLEIVCNRQFGILRAQLSGSAIDAFVVTAVGDGDAQIMDHPAVAVHQSTGGGFYGGCNWGSSSHLYSSRLYRFSELCR